jgi:phenylacetate-CoA ligase
MFEPDSMNSADLKLLQEQRFQNVLSLFWKAPLYQRKLRQAGLEPDSLQSLGDLSSVPFTTKEDLRQTHPSERSPFSYQQIEYLFSSSGTSGEPTVYYWTHQDTEVLREAGARAMRRVGITSDDLSLVLAPLGLPIMWYCMFQQYNALGAGVIPLGVRSPSEIINALTTYPVSVISTLPVLGTRLYEFMMSTNNKWSEDRPLRQFHCGGDFLTENRRRRIESLWNVKCYNFFGMSEIFGPIAGECTHQAGMHFLADQVYLEVLDPETHLPIPDGKPGVAVYTTLWPKGSLLLRYWSDDFIMVNQDVCVCGKKSPRITFLGRPLDMAWVNGSRLFTSQIEETVLAFSQVSSEFQLYLNNDPVSGDTANLIVEETQGARIPIVEVQDALSFLLKIPVTVKVSAAGTLPRDASKPRRIFDHRTANIRSPQVT